MITVTTPSAINTITPVMDGVANPSTIGTTLPNEGFTTALNTQLNLVSPPVTEGAALASAQAALLAATSATVSTDVLANAATTTLTTQQPAVLTDTTAQNPTLLTASTMTSQTPLAETVMTTEDSAILSNVTDTLKFIATGAKLGDTLPTGQSVQLPTANATPLTQQTVQSAVQQAVTNKQVNTPATVLAQQATPVQIAQLAATQTPVEVQAQTLILSQQAQTMAAPVQVQTSVVSQQTPAVTAQGQTPVAQQQATVVTAQVQTPVAVSQTVQVQAPVIQQAATTETHVVAQAQTSVVQQSTVQTQTPVVAQQPTVSVQTAITQPQASVVNEQTQTVIVAQQIETSEQTVVTTPVQTPVAQQAQATAAKASQVQMPVAQQDVLIETAPVQTSVAQSQTPVTTTQAQNAVMPLETVPVVAEQVLEQASVKTATVQTAVTQQATPVETAQVQKQAQKPAETTTVQVALAQQTSTTETVVAEQVQVQQLVSQQATEKTEKTSTVKTEDNTQVEPSLVIETAPQMVEQNLVNVESVAQNVAEPETQKSQHQDAPAVQTTVENAAPIVTAQSAPAQVETEVATFDAPTSSAPEDKPTLTPAKNLLADVLANRSNGGDTAGNSSDKRGSDTPSNPTMQADSLLKTATDGKSGVDTKSFASLLNSEKSDVIAAPTVDKAAPQVATAAVNKLAQDMKAEVPALTRPLSHPDWNQDMGERIVWMNNRGISSAEIKMNPQNMGPITVRIDMNQDQATIAFTAQNSDVRNALEASIPKLREMLNSQNVNLADVNVSQQSSTSTDSGRSQQQTAQMAADASANGQGNRQANQEVDANGNPIRQVNANGEEVMVDEFANGQVLSNNGTNGLLSIYA